MIIRPEWAELLHVDKYNKADSHFSKFTHCVGRMRFWVLNLELLKVLRSYYHIPCLSTRILFNEFARISDHVIVWSDIWQGRAIRRLWLNSSCGRGVRSDIMSSAKEASVCVVCLLSEVRYNLYRVQVRNFYATPYCLVFGRWPWIQISPRISAVLTHVCAFWQFFQPVVGIVCSLNNLMFKVRSI